MTENLIGTWKLSHCKVLDTNGVEQFDPFGDALGLLVYDDKGTMSAQLMKRGHQDSLPEDLFSASDASYKKFFENYVAYYGTYIINKQDSIVSHSIHAALWPNMVGLTVSRRFEFQDKNTLVLSNVEPEALANAIPITRYLTWLRVTTSLDQ